MIGQTLLHYRIVDKIGAGGMGVVYKALDTHLDRPVAVKVLPADRVADPDRKSRFIQEARAASALRHPNIVVIHDIASDQGLDFMVMELVEGRPLDEVIGRKGLKLADALSVAVQIAEGLAKAHAAGIVHRDLKPGNVMVTDDGLIKILDFGLAKLTEDVPGRDAGPTVTLNADGRPRTEEGVIFGTAAYMSPEQAEGKAVDARSDIFSFGAVLYEMLTGHKAFGRDSAIKTLAAVLNEEPAPASSLAEAVPPELVRFLARCLRKDPQRRWQTMSDLKIALQDIKEDSASGRLQAALPAARKRKSPALTAAAALLLVVAAALAVKLLVLKPAGPIEYEISPLTYDSGFTGSPTLSVDGNLMAFSSDRGDASNMDIWVRQLAGGNPLRLTDHPADDWQPSFSPDGSQVAFRSDREGGGIYVVDALGSEPRQVADKGFSPKFSPDGRLIAYVVIPPSLEGRHTKMYLVSPRGGEPRPFFNDFLPAMTLQGAALVWSPDGKHLIFRGRRVEDARSGDWWVAPVDGGKASRTHAVENLGLVTLVHYPVGWVGNDIYYVSGTTIEGVNLFRVSIDPKDLTVRGPAENVTTGPGMKVFPAIASDGRVVFTNMTAAITTWSVSARADEAVITGDPGRLTQDLMQKFSPTISRDGSKAAFMAFGGIRDTRFEVRVKDLRAGQETAFPVQGGVLGGTVLSPDGSRLAYRDIVDGKMRTYILAPGAATGREVCAGCYLLDIFPGNAFAVT
ncbi:MAG: serine/threonine-protein kinase, partial [Candidatus Aminicenantes bacterium]|nr:serine/threonine-protein kinase [Candidatus Aminicenantes bacterium]